METLSQSKIKQIRSLHLKKMRDEQGLFIVEGEKTVLEVLESIPGQIVFCAVTREFDEVDRFPEIQWYLCDEETLKRCSTLKTPNKVIAIVKKLASGNKNESFILALDSIQDPGNMGTIIRLADWFGVSRIICSHTTVDCYNPKVIQASMGSFLRVSIDYVDLKMYLEETALPIYGALLEGENVYKKKLPAEGILLMGNEGNGISEELRLLIQHPISIPRLGHAESLNVSMATGILLSEFFRS